MTNYHQLQAKINSLSGTWPSRTHDGMSGRRVPDISGIYIYATRHHNDIVKIGATSNFHDRLNDLMKYSTILERAPARVSIRKISGRSHWVSKLVVEKSRGTVVAPLFLPIHWSLIRQLENCGVRTLPTAKKYSFSKIETSVAMNFKNSWMDIVLHGNMLLSIWLTDSALLDL